MGNFITVSFMPYGVQSHLAKKDRYKEYTNYQVDVNNIIALNFEKLHDQYGYLNGGKIRITYKNRRYDILSIQGRDEAQEIYDLISGYLNNI